MLNFSFFRVNCHHSKTSLFKDICFQHLPSSTSSTFSKPYSVSLEDFNAFIPFSNSLSPMTSTSILINLLKIVPLSFCLLCLLSTPLNTSTSLPTTTRSSAIAEGPRDASCQLKSCQLPRNSVETTYTTSPDQIDGMKLEI